jgi:flagellar basal-body rod protein FlgG
MTFLKNAALSIVALVLVTGTLIGVHVFINAVHSRSSARTVSQLSLFPSHSGPIGFPKGVRVTRRLRPFTMKVANAFPHGQDDDPFAAPLHAVQQSGAEKPANSKPPLAPSPLPAPSHAVPMPSAADDWPPPGEPAKAGTAPSAPVPSGPRAPDSKGRRLIDKELPNSSAEERDLWHETTRDLPLNDLRELLRLRAQIGRLSPPWSDIHHSPNQQTAPAPSSPMTGNGPFPSAPSDGTGPATAEPDPGRVLSATMAAIAQARQVLLNNIANAQTNGYKRRLVSFESAADQSMTSSLPENPFQIRFGLPADVGARLSPVVCDMAAGKLVATNRSLDLAIEGPGFFRLVDGQKKREVCTRRGRFTLNKSGQLALAATGGEWMLEPPVAIPTGVQTVEISSDGQVRGWDAEKHTSRTFGSLQTACFPAQTVLIPSDGTFFILPDGASLDIKSPGVSGHGFIRQGCLEESNVDVKHELEDLARLAAQLQALEQAARLLQAGGLDRPAVPSEAVTPAPAGSLP